MSVCFKVQKIIGVSVGEGNLRNYQVQWAPTWVSSLHLEGCENLIEEFMQSEKDQFGRHEASMVAQNCLYKDESSDEFDETTMPIVYMDEPKSVVEPNLEGTDILRESPWEQKDVFSSGLYHENDNNNNQGKQLVDHTGKGAVPVLNHLSSSSEDFLNSSLPVKTGEDVSPMDYADIRSSKTLEHDGQMTTLERLIHDTKLDLLKASRKNSLEDILLKKFPYNLDEHLDTLHDDTLGEEEIAGTSNATDLFQCTICDKKFKNSSGLTRHTNYAHSSNQSFTCPVCNLTFKCQVSLRRHTRTHTGIKEYTCATCNEQFEDKDDFRMHLSTNPDHKRSYPCPFCGKIFTCNFGLKRHERVHTNERPFQCEVCDKRFKTNDHLQKHIRTHRDVFI